MRRGRLHRLLHIVKQVRRGAYPNCRTLAEELEVSTRTILRDLELLRDDWNAPLAFSHAHRGFYLADSDWVPPVGGSNTEIRLSAGEALALVLALHTFDALQAHGLEPAFRSLLDKLPRLLPETVSVNLVELAQQVSFFFHPPRGEPEAIAEYLARLREAVEARRVVDMTYYTASRDEVTRRQVEPYYPIRRPPTSRWRGKTRRVCDAGAAARTTGRISPRWWSGLR